jgi:hypothetical protein
MFLREFIYFDDKNVGPQEDDKYLSQNDTGILRRKDIRKSRITLRMINDIRKAGEAHEQEIQNERTLIRKMYAAPPPEAAAA